MKPRKPRRPLTAPMVRFHWRETPRPSLNTLAAFLGLPHGEVKRGLLELGGLDAILAGPETAQDGQAPEPVSEQLAANIPRFCGATAGTGMSGVEWEELCTLLQRRDR